MLTAEQFKNLMSAALDAVRSIVAAEHPVAGSIVGTALTVFEMYEPQIIALLQQKGIIKNTGT